MSVQRTHNSVHISRKYTLRLGRYTTTLLYCTAIRSITTCCSSRPCVSSPSSTSSSSIFFSLCSPFYLLYPPSLFFSKTSSPAFSFHCPIIGFSLYFQLNWGAGSHGIIEYVICSLSGTGSASKHNQPQSNTHFFLFVQLKISFLSDIN